MLSEGCASYDKMRIIYNGTPSKITSTKMIPPFCREAITAYVVERAFHTLSISSPNHARLYEAKKRDLYTPPNRMEYSKWDQAKYNLKDLDEKQRVDLADYLSAMNY